MSEANSLDKLIVVGDRVLIKPKAVSQKTKGGLYLPPGYKEKEEIQTGYVVKRGPGYPIPMPSEEDEPWFIDALPDSFRVDPKIDAEQIFDRLCSVYRQLYKGQRFGIVELREQLSVR